VNRVAEIKKVELRIPASLHSLVAIHAEESNRTLNKTCIDIFRHFFESNPDTNQSAIPTKRFGLRIPKDLYIQAVNYAGIKGITVNSACIEIFWWFFENGKINQHK